MKKRIIYLVTHILSSLFIGYFIAFKKSNGHVLLIDWILGFIVACLGIIVIFSIIYLIKSYIKGEF